jgi:hypothetical protein
LKKYLGGNEIYHTKTHPGDSAERGQSEFRRGFFFAAEILLRKIISISNSSNMWACFEIFLTLA